MGEELEVEPRLLTHGELGRLRASSPERCLLALACVFLLALGLLFIPLQIIPLQTGGEQAPGAPVGEPGAVAGAPATGGPAAGGRAPAANAPASEVGGAAQDALAPQPRDPAADKPGPESGAGDKPSPGAAAASPAPDGDERPAGVPDGPMLAIVIDDWGYAWEAADDFLALDVPLNVAVIPHLPLSRRHAEEAAARGHQVLLHLPMEPLSPGWDLGEGAVTTAMAAPQIQREVLRALDSVPGVQAVNNHMGSKATADPRVMRAVLEALKERGLFFLDSRTTAGSVAVQVARELGVPVLENDRFIDPDFDPERIKERLLSAARIAEERGWAVVIGHVRPATYEGVVRALPELSARGVRLVRLDDILAKVKGSSKPAPAPEEQGAAAGG